MALTTFVDFSDPKVNAAWLNGVDQVVNGTLGSNIAAPASGAVLVGDGVSFVNKQLVAGANVTITQGAGTVTITGTASSSPGTSTVLAPRPSVAGTFNIVLAQSPNHIWVIFTGQGVISSTQVGVTLPPSPFDGQIVYFNINEGGTGNLTLNFTPAAGNLALLPGTPITSFQGMAVHYNAAVNKWLMRITN